MAVSLSPFAGAGWQFFDNNGVILSGGKLYTYVAGTTTPAATYIDVAGIQNNTNPIILNSAGRVSNEIWLTSNTNYKFVLKDSTDVLIGTWDNIPSGSTALSSSTGATLVGFTGANGAVTTVAGLAANSGSDLVGYLPSGTNAEHTTVQAKLREIISVKDFGAVGDGVTDDTDAIQAAISSSLQMGTNGGGVEIFFPKGIYLCQIVIDGYSPGNDVGENSLTLNGYAATLKGRASDTSIIQINGAVANVVDPHPGGNIYANGLVIQGFTLDMSAMANSAAVYGIAAQHSYACTVKDIHVYADPALGGGLFLGSQTYTWTVINLACNRIKIHGYNSSTNQSTVHNFYNIDVNQAVLENCFSIGFFGGVIQGSLDHFVLSGAQAITVMGMDLEGPNTGEVVYNIGPTCRSIVSIGNSCGGYTVDTYSSGYAPNSNFTDRPNISGLNGIGTYGRTASQGQVYVPNATLTGVSITSTTGQFSCSASTLSVGQQVVISGTFGGTGSITGYSDPTTYYIIATNGTTTFTLSTSSGGSAVTTTAGTPTGLTYTIPATIYNFKDTLSGQNMGLFLITGDNGSDGFQDLIMVAFSFVTVIKSQGVYGSPATRVYSVSGDKLLASYVTGTTNMRPVCMEFLMSSL